MIRILSGIIIQASAPVFVIDVNGVGYEVISTTLKVKLKSKITCSIFTVVKEDSLTLYGFNNEDERGLFAMLISVNGVGPKSALQIMQFMSPAEISKSLSEANAKPFQKVKGIGKKVAERIVIDLAGSLNREIEESDEALQVAAALQNLGYTRREYQPLMKDLPEGDLQKQLTWALQKLGQS